ncbi:MAG: hypothetical protein ACM34K_20135 [Bacillota bacterium]
MDTQKTSQKNKITRIIQAVEEYINELKQLINELEKEESGQSEEEKKEN